MASSDKGVTAPTLIVTGGGPLDGQSLTIAHGESTLLGSGPNSVLALQLANVAAEHARLLWAGVGLLLSDLDSPTGTYVNGERIDSEHPLADGDRVCLGPPGSKQSVKFLVRLPETTAGPLLFDDAETEGTLDLRGPASASAGLGLEDGPAEAPSFDFGGSLEGPASPEATPLVLIDPTAGTTRRGDALGITATASDELEGALPRSTQPPVPAPVPEPPPRPAAPPPPPPSSDASQTGSRKAVKAEYTSDMPSMVPERAREAPSVAAMPAVKPAAPLTRRAPGSSSVRIGRFGVPRLAVVVVASLAVGLALVAGLRVALLPAPGISEVAPASIFPGGTIVITGSGFSSSPTGNEVQFGSEKGKVSAASAERLTVEVPQIDLSQGPRDVQVSVRANGKISASHKLRLYLVSRIQSVQPDVALPGDELLLTLGSPPDGTPVVRVKGLVAELLDNKGTLLRVRVPETNVPLGTRVPVSLEGVGDPGPPAFMLIGRLPLLSEIAPAAGLAGTRVVLTGRGFARETGQNAVTFGGRNAAVLSASATALLVSAPPPPASESQLQAPVSVTVNGTASNPLPFTQKRPSSAAFVPRFFVAQVEGQPQQLFVSSELGALILLGEQDAAPSLGERAARLADALNTAVDATQNGQAPAFELRESPRPGVGLAGGALLLAAAPGDVAAYQSQAKGQQVSPRGLAAYWNALLQDYFALFTVYRRPSAVAELSPRGRVLIDLFADAQRHGATSGVPRSLLLPLTPNLERDLRELALLLPTGAAQATVAGLAIEGTWSGSTDETGVGTREIQLSLQRQGGKLGGSLTTRSRALSMGIPLTSVSYDKGTLRFTALIGGAPREFVGTLQGATLNGSVQTPGGKTTLGSFKLNFVK